MRKRNILLILILLFILGYLFVTLCTVQSINKTRTTITHIEHAYIQSHIDNIQHDSEGTGNVKTTTSSNEHARVPLNSNKSNPGSFVPKPKSDLKLTTDTANSIEKVEHAVFQNHISINNKAKTESLISIDKRLNLTHMSQEDVSSLILSEIDAVFRYNYYAIEQQVLARKNRIEDVCESIKNKRFDRPFLFYFSELNLSWCPTYKAGSTNWKVYFVNRFVNPNIEDPSMELIWHRRLSGSSGMYRDGKKRYRIEKEGTIRFSVVRHPIVRVISYWKMSRGHTEIARTGAHAEIMGRRPVPPQYSNYTGQFALELKQYIEWCKEVDAGSADKELIPFSISEHNPYLHPPHITFPELVDRIKDQRERLKTRDWEGHWAPASEWCDMCIHKLDYVIKLENEPWELFYLLDRIGLWADRTKFLSQKNKSGDKPSDASEISKFTQMLNDEQKKYLNFFYRNDNSMFGYEEVI